MSLATIQTYTLDNVKENEKLFFYCHQLSASIENLKASINKYEKHKQTKKISVEVDDDRT